MKTKFLSIILLALLSFLPVTQSSATVIYDLVDDWSTVNGNPNGVWTYGRYVVNSLTATTSFTAFSTAGTLTGLESWDSGTTDPNISYNQTGTTKDQWGITWDPGAVVFGPAGGPTVARFTAPTTGSYSIDVYFEGVQTGNSNTLGALNHNSSNLFTSTSLGFGVSDSFSTSPLVLAAGDTLDAVVGTGAKSTEVRFTITSVPESSSSLALLGIGIVAICGFGIRKPKN